MEDRTAAPLVLVTVGTDHHPFDRLVRWVDAWFSSTGREHGARCLIQYGRSVAPTQAEGRDFLSPQELEDRLREAAVVVCHGGPGTIMGARDAGHVPVVAARESSLGEHVDDHQVRFATRLGAAGAVHLVESEEGLRALLDQALEDPAAFRRPPGGDAGTAAAVARFGELAAGLTGGAQDDPLRILYIGGWGRSGSTLLDRMLGQVPGVFSAGELRDIWQRGVLENRLCGCGTAFHDCSFWSAVGDEAFGGWNELDVASVQRLRERLDRPWSPPAVVSSRLVPAVDRRVSSYVDTLSRLYGAIRSVSGARVIVDSSKIVTYALLLKQIPGADLRMVHLVRDSRGVVFSWQKQVVREDGPGRDEMLRYGVASASGRYLFYNSLAHAVRLMRTPYMFLRYEDLIARPAPMMRRVLDHAGIDATGDALSFLAGGTADLGTNHTVDGNPMRLKTGPVTLRLDDEWRRKMSGTERRIVTAVTSPLLAAYGYPIGGRGEA